MSKFFWMCGLACGILTVILAVYLHEIRQVELAILIGSLFLFIGFFMCGSVAVAACM